MTIETINQMTDSEVQEIKVSVGNMWEGIALSPEQLTGISDQKVLFTAGGGLVTQFGEDNIIWKTMEDKAGNSKVLPVADINFSLTDLAMLGDYYRHLKKTGFSFHCIDERLDGDIEHLHDEVHEGCGACAAVGIATGLMNVEDELLSILGQKVKQSIYPDMPNHESMVILIDLHGSDVVLGQKREELKNAKALPFNVSLDLNLIQSWAQETGNDPENLLAVLVNWNVQIARNIIGSSHNNLQQIANETILVVDTRGVEDNPLFPSMTEKLKQVEHGNYLEIRH